MLIATNVVSSVLTSPSITSLPCSKKRTAGSGDVTAYECGVLMILQSRLLLGKRYVMGMKQHSRASEETVASARLLRKVMQPVMPMALCRDEAALGAMGVTFAAAARLWDIQYNLTLDYRIRAQLETDSGGSLGSKQQAHRGATEKASLRFHTTNSAPLCRRHLSVHSSSTMTCMCLNRRLHTTCSLARRGCATLLCQLSQSARGCGVRPLHPTSAHA